MEIRYQFFEEEKLLIQKFSGFFSFEFYKENSEEMYQKHKTKEVKKVLIDFRDIKITNDEDESPEDFDRNLEEVLKYRKKVSENQPGANDVKVVFWVDAPLPTVVAYLFVNNMSNKNLSYCSTEDKIIETLELDTTFMLEQKVENLDLSFVS